MVGYDPRQTSQLSHTEHALAGAVSGAVTRAVCQPLDVIKIRFQLQTEPVTASSGSKYHGVVQAVGRILQEEGLQALWKGHAPAQVLSVMYGVVQYTSFEVLTASSYQHLPRSWSHDHRPTLHSLCGCISGCLASAVIHPMDLIRTRFVAQGEPKVYTSILQAYQAILHAEGVKGFYRGLSPAMAQVGPQMGLQFGFYTLFTEAWAQSMGDAREGRLASLAQLTCGTGSGILSKLLVYPLDVVKKRLQVQGFEEARRSFGEVKVYTGLVHCVARMAREEGMRGLFKGLGPSLLKSGAVAGLNFWVYEQVRSALVASHGS